MAYTAKSLTYKTDIFPALQGLAKKFGKGMGRYYAGHWETTLLSSLVWSRHENLRARPQSPAKWRAPTWSWASVNGGVWFEYFGSEVPNALVTVLNVRTTPVGDDPMGQISSGTLVLAGRCVHATLESEWEREGVLERYCIQSSQRADSEAGRLCLRESTYRPFSNSGVQFDYDFGIAGPYHIPSGSKILLMKIAETKNAYDETPRYWLMFREINADEHICERIGMIEVREENETATMMDQVFEKEAVDMEITIV
jgi:hypothetical protein